MGSWIPACLLVAFLIVGIILPSARTYRRFGTWLVVFRRRAAPLQRLLSFAFSACILAVAGWAVACRVLGPARERCSL